MSLIVNKHTTPTNFQPANLRKLTKTSTIMSMISPQYFTSTNNNTFPRHVAIGTSNSNTIYSTPNNSLHLVINSQEDYNSYVSIEFKKHMRRVQFKNEIILGSKIMQTRIKERESVNKISEEKIETPWAYMLFYKIVK